MITLRRSSRRVIRGLTLTLSAPADGWLAARMLAWRAALPALRRLLPLPRLVGLMDARPAGERPRRGGERPVAWVAERVFDVARSEDNCLDLSLVTYRYLARAGEDPRLVIAVRKDGDLTRGHAWVTVGGTPVHDSAALLEDFTAVITFKPGAARASEVGKDPSG